MCMEAMEHISLTIVVAVTFVKMTVMIVVTLSL